tara:strand:+ start:427 stop:687 length:261 start_codon:yes stop_codon:yes gene_type:complete
MTKQKPRCVICLTICENEWGNNPAPIMDMAYGVCCDSCNWEFVIPARLGRLSISKLQYLNDNGLLEDLDDACDTANDSVISNDGEE